ncbi:13142_t:CDS:2, partial [Racocetra persica]
EWDLSNEDQVIDRDQFLQENNLNINPEDIRCKWSIRYSIAPGSRVSTACYLYVRCLVFVTISLRNDEICGIAG